MGAALRLAILVAAVVGALNCLYLEETFLEDRRFIPFSIVDLRFVEMLRTNC